MAGCLNLVGALDYVVETLRGRTQPNRVTWALWTLPPFIAFAASADKRVGIEGAVTLAAGVGPLAVLASSFVNYQAHWAVTRLDCICGTVSVTALALWALTGEADVDLVLAIVADAMAALPTTIKAYRDPKSENRISYICLSRSADWSLC